MRHLLLSRWEGTLFAASWGLDCSLIWQQGIETLATKGDWQPSLSRESPGEILLVSLPRLLFFCDQPKVAIRQSDHLAEAQLAITSYTRVMATIFAEQLVRERLFQDLQLNLWQEDDYEILQTLQISLEQGKSLQEVNKQLPPSCWEIWLALYCFVTSAEDLVLTVNRANQFGGAEVMALVGALSGAHNGMSAIPVPWRCRYREQLKCWKAKLEAMFITWSGSYQFGKMGQSMNINQLGAIALPGVIQARPSIQN
ncbi:MAG: ADP-ribosylglycohydrolase family protein [Halothece sp.]